MAVARINKYRTPLSAWMPAGPALFIAASHHLDGCELSQRPAMLPNSHVLARIGRAISVTHTPTIAAPSRAPLLTHSPHGGKRGAASAALRLAGASALSCSGVASGGRGRAGWQPLQPLRRPAAAKNSVGIRSRTDWMADSFLR